MHKIVSSVVLTALASSLALAYPAHAASPKAQAATVKEAPLRAHLAFLASDALDGRGTGQRGGGLSVTYLEIHCAAIGLQPANTCSIPDPGQVAG